MTSNRLLLSWMIVACLTAALTAVTSVQALWRYQELRTGWSWDLAYYNQWYWALTQGDGRISVRPLASYAEEGPSVWKMNYLAPIRLVLVPFYRIYPDPRTLLVIQNIVFWWIIPAAYTLARSESRSEAIALSAALLVPLCPLLWPLVWNDFRELQLALPFVVWAVQGVRSRHVVLAGLGIMGMLGCRQEFAVMVATFGFLPPQEPESFMRTLRWRQALFSLGLAWLLFGFFGYLRFMVAPSAPGQFIDQFLGPRATVLQTLETAADFLGFGLGAWAIFACLAPRVAILAVPWIWTLCDGRWSLRFLATEQWHHVRYTVLPTVMVLAAGLVGYARLGTWLRGRRRGWLLMAVVWIAGAAGCGLGLKELSGRMSRIPHPISPQEADAIWYWIGQVGPDDGVLATYEVTAPLSSRKRLYSYILDQNKPHGFPKLGPEFQWVFYRNPDFPPALFLEQGFDIVHKGDFLTILRRFRPSAPAASMITPQENAPRTEPAHVPSPRSA
jgi:hypothetical protein